MCLSEIGVPRTKNWMSAAAKIIIKYLDFLPIHEKQTTERKLFFRTSDLFAVLRVLAYQVDLE